MPVLPSIRKVGYAAQTVALCHADHDDGRIHGHAELQRGGMRGRIQDVLRSWISRAVRAWGRRLARRHARRLADFSANQRRLRTQYDITDETPLTETALAADTLGPQRHAESVTLDAFYRMMAALDYARTSRYVFRSPDADAAEGTDEGATLPPYWATLQSPDLAHDHPALLALEKEYGRSAVRFWVLVLSNPGVLYVTNPFTLAVFLDELSDDWLTTTALVRAWQEDPTAWGVPVRRIAKRLQSAGASHRIRRIATSETALAFLECVPAVGLLCCWAGDWVRPALDRVWSHMPRDAVHHVPMHSASAHGAQTVPHFQDKGIALLPVAPGVLCEFLPLDDHPTDAVVEASMLKPDASYMLVVSDAFGSRRHPTQDVFRVHAIVDELPDLRFERRLGHRHSFVGEALTGEDARSAIAQVLAYRPDMEAAPWLTVMPTEGTPPHYTFVVAWDTPVSDLEDAGKLLDKALAFANHDYADHRRHERLGPIVAVQMSVDAAVQCAVGDRPDPDSATGFRFLPLVNPVAKPAE